MEKPLQVFCCSAREDQSLLFDLKKQLRVLEHDGLITVQAEITIDPGENREQKINHYLNTAQIILLLISPDFIASEYCYSKEMRRALERYERGECHVIPILLRPILWESTPFGKLQALPMNGEPIAGRFWHTPDEGWLDVALGIRERAQTIRLSTEKVRAQLQLRKTALFGYETQGGRDSALWRDPAACSLSEAYQKWSKTKRDLTEAEIVDRTWVKAGDHGFAFLNHFFSDGRLVEYAFADPATRWQGRWQLLDGILRTTIHHHGIFELDILAHSHGQVYSGIESLNAQEAAAYFRLLPSRQEAGQREEVLTAYDQLLRVNPHCAEAYTTRGNLLRNLKRFEEALADYEGALKLGSQVPAIWTYKGEVLRMLQRYTEALAAYDQALKLEASHVEAFLGKGRVYLGQKDYRRALQAYEQATDVAPESTWAWHEKGQALGHLQRVEEALEAFEQAIKRDPDNTWAWFHKAETLAYLARQAYKKAGQPGEKPLKRDFSTLLHRASGKCLDGNGTSVYLHELNGGDYQLWRAQEVAAGILIFQHFQSARVLEATEQRGTFLSAYSGSFSQHWMLEDGDGGWKRLKHRASGLVLHADTNNDVYLQPGNGGDSQAWAPATIHFPPRIVPTAASHPAELLTFEQ
ncbi:MAG TPA: tetratricopeptide repeat protein [Ktedonobacteraceae bacterium]|jgi:tetratricopeptide (TPR) repeat protein